jgi:hypothetical protein
MPAAVFRYFKIVQLVYLEQDRNYKQGHSDFFAKGDFLCKYFFVIS